MIHINLNSGPNRPLFLLRVLLRLLRLDMIFSQCSEDLHQLVEEAPISTVLQELTPVQKQVLFENIILDVPVKDIARAMGCSHRNVTKHRQRALEKIRLSMARGVQNSGEGL